jgi:hypothetical protein
MEVLDASIGHAPLAHEIEVIRNSLPALR